MNELIFRCSDCGEPHDLGDLSLGADAPDQWSNLTERERTASWLTPDVCTIQTADETHYFIRGCLRIPILGLDRSFTWGVWTSLSRKSFLEVEAEWGNSARVNMGPYFGWLCTLIPTYPDTMFLKTMVHQRPPGERPDVHLEPTAHPLAVHQRQGIELSELKGTVRKILHSQSPE